MKSKTVWCVAVLAIASMFLLSSAGAYSLDGQYNRGPVRTYTYNATDTSLPRFQPSPQYVPSYPVQGASIKQRTVAQQQPVPSTTNKQILPDNSTNRPSRPITKSAAKKKQAQNADIRSNQKQVNQHQLSPAVYSYYPNQATQYRTQPQNGSYQAPVTSYYRNPYEIQHKTAPNYYQSYSYSGWGSTGQACAPGKA